MFRFRTTGLTQFALALPGLLLSSFGCQDFTRIPVPVPIENPVAEPVNAGPWSGWRGGIQQGFGGWEAVGIVDGSLRVRWKVPLRGTGNSSPVVVDQTILLTAEVGRSPSNGTPPDLALLAVDLETGSERWARVVGPARGSTHHKTGYAAATIAASSQRGYAFFGEAGLICFDIETGDELWRKEFPGNRHEWGVVSSPVLFGDVVIQLVDGEQGESFLAAFDQESGQEVWRTARASHGCWTSPLLMTSPGADRSEAGSSAASRVAPVRSVSRALAPQLIINGTGHKNGSPGWLISYDPQTGEELWRARGTSDIVVPTALAWNDLVISASGGNGPVFAVRSDGRGDCTATHLQWRLPTGGPYVPTGLVMDDRLYLLADGGVLTCRDAATGDLLGRQRLPGTYTASLLGLGGYLIAVNEAGELHVLEANDQLTRIASLSLHERCLATPAIVETSLFLRTAHHLYCLEFGNGALEGSGGVELRSAASGDSARADARQRPSGPAPVDERQIADGGISP